MRIELNDTLFDKLIEAIYKKSTDSDLTEADFMADNNLDRSEYAIIMLGRLHELSFESLSIIALNMQILTIN